MLVLTRRRQEAVICTLPDGRDITVMVTEIKGGRVKLGFDADADIPIRRDELPASPAVLPDPVSPLPPAAMPA